MICNLVTVFLSQYTETLSKSDMSILNSKLVKFDCGGSRCSGGETGRHVSFKHWSAEMRVWVRTPPGVQKEKLF